MNRGHLGYRYAKALYLTANGDVRLLARFGRELKLFRDLYVDEKLDRVLSNPAFLLSERYIVIDKISDLFDFHKYTRNLLKLMEKRGRMPLVDDILRSYRKIMDSRMEAGYLSILTDQQIPYDVFAQYRRKVQKLMESMEVSIRSKVEPENVGVGARIMMEGRIVDASIEGMVQRLLDRLGIPKGG